MKLTCPCCGAVCSAEAWQNDIDARVVLAAAVKLQDPIPRQVLPYLGLFRPRERSLSWKRTRTLLAELAALVSTGYVQFKGKPARPCPPQVWAKAMEQMVDRGETITRPMTSHNYLRQVAWDLADRLDADIEARRNQEERSGQARADRQIERQEAVEVSPEELETLNRLGLGDSIRKMQQALGKHQE